MAYFTGDSENFFTGDIMNDKYYFSNDVDGLFVWDMAEPGVEKVAAFSSRKVIKFGERLCHFNTTEVGTRYPQRCKWSVVADPEDYAGAGSGYNDLITVLGVDHLQSAAKLGAYIAVYAERTIALMEYKPVVDEPFSFYTRVSGVGLAAPRALIGFGGEHIFLGWDDIYSYEGGRSVTGIGGSVKDELFKIINPEYILISYMVYIEEEDVIRLHIPIEGSELPNAYFEYSLKTRVWTRGMRDFTSYGYYTTVAKQTWDEMTMAWKSATGRWDDAALLALAPITLYGDEDGGVHKENPLLVDNSDGTAIDELWESKDYIRGDGYRHELTNWMDIQFEARGQGVTIQYSTDKGDSWNTGKKFELDARWRAYEYDFGVNSPQIRFRFRSNVVGEKYELRHIRIGYLEATDRGM